MKKWIFFSLLPFCALAINAQAPTGVQSVDLGLSVKWANMNVGATTAEGYGDYFAWGEVTPKDTFSWSTYKWYKFSSSDLTKYNTNSIWGIVDSITILELPDDAANVNWGGLWRMPTIIEWAELYDNCKWTWTTENGVHGYRVSGNGNFIFLPAAGFLYDVTLNGTDAFGLYWSSSLSSDMPDYAWYVCFFSGSVAENHYSRYGGHSVRPVYSSSSTVLGDVNYNSHINKFIQNGRLYIIQNGHTYDASGREVK